MQRFDAIVVGAGFGGLGAALRLAERGARVCVSEALTYPGGCASTFTRGGRRYEAGATLFSGLGPDQLFGRWSRQHRMDYEVDWVDPVVTLRGPFGELPVLRDREAFIERLCHFPQAPVGALRAFFDAQRRIADTLWSLFDTPASLPPWTASALANHALSALRYAPLAAVVGRPLAKVLDYPRLRGFAPFETWARALCQITVQCSPDEVEAPFALAALDYAWRGTGHVRGGIGQLASALVGAIERAGGQVRFADRVSALEQSSIGWRVRSRRGEATAPVVLCNAAPGVARRLAGLEGDAGHGLARLEARVATGWGASMQYLTLAPAEAEEAPHHIECVADAALPFEEGNHIFVSIGDPDARGRRSATVSTHVRPVPSEPPAEYFARIQAAMTRTLSLRAPEVAARVEARMTGSPRTFERFTGRPGGFVGGVPRRAGLHNYTTLSPTTVAEGLYLVGDAVFPGQSTLATALGGHRAADAAVPVIERASGRDLRPAQ